MTISNPFDEDQLKSLFEFAYSHKNCSDVFADLPNIIKSTITEKIISVLRLSYSSDQWYYTGESNVVWTSEADALKLVNNSLFFHRDIRGIGATLPLSCKNDCLIRVGLYLQNTVNTSDGTKFILRSHYRPFFFSDLVANLKHYLRGSVGLSSLYFDFGFSRFFLSRNIATRTGDMVVWTSRTVHSACFKRLKILPKLVLPPFLERILPRALFVPLGSPRVVIFFNFALKGASIAEDYIRQRKSVGAIK